MNFREAIDIACCEPTLEKALACIALWECERVIPLAHEFLSNKKNHKSYARAWDTCFEYLIRETMEQYTFKRLKGN